MPDSMFPIQRHSKYYTTSCRLTVLTILHNEDFLGKYLPLSCLRTIASAYDHNDIVCRIHPFVHKPLQDDKTVYP